MEELNKQQEEVVVTEEKQEEKETQQKQEEAKTFKQEEVDKLIQAETDRKVSKALETAKTKWQEEFKAQLESEKSEAQRLAALSEEDRYKAELEKEKAEFEKERKSFLKEKLENQTIKELSNQQLPISFSNFVVGETAEEIHQNITTLKAEWDKAFTEALEKAINDRIQGKTPASSNKQSGSLTREQFINLPPAERNKTYNENPEFFKELLAK